MQTPVCLSQNIYQALLQMYRSDKCNAWQNFPQASHQHKYDKEEVTVHYLQFYVFLGTPMAIFALKTDEEALIQQKM